MVVVGVCGLGFSEGLGTTLIWGEVGFEVLAWVTSGIRGDDAVCGGVAGEGVGVDCMECGNELS